MHFCQIYLSSPFRKLSISEQDSNSKTRDFDFTVLTTVQHSLSKNVFFRLQRKIELFWCISETASKKICQKVWPWRKFFFSSCCEELFFSQTNDSAQEFCSAFFYNLRNSKASFYFLSSNTLTHCVAALLRRVNGVWAQGSGKADWLEVCSDGTGPSSPSWHQGWGGKHR